MSELKTNKVTPATGTSITLGDSGDTFTLPSGATLSGAGAITVPSGGSLTIDSGATITNNGTNGGGFGKVLQVVQATKTDTFSTTSTSFVDLSGLSASITPSSSSNKVLVLLSIGSLANTTNTSLINLVRNSTNIAQPDSGTNPASINHFTASAGAPNAGTLTWLDSPSTTSATTYKAQMRVDSSTGYLNRHTGNTNYNSVSSITLMEIAG